MSTFSTKQFAIIKSLASDSKALAKTIAVYNTPEIERSETDLATVSRIGARLYLDATSKRAIGTMKHKVDCITAQANAFLARLVVEEYLGGDVFAQGIACKKLLDDALRFCAVFQKEYVIAKTEPVKVAPVAPVEVAPVEVAPVAKAKGVKAA